jgi:hypothetical protein
MCMFGVFIAMWPDSAAGREGVMSAARRMKDILDEDGMRYRGRNVYVP